MRNDKIYFAAEQDPIEFARKAIERVERFDKHCKSTGMLYKWRKAWRAYHNMSMKSNNQSLFSSHELQPAGEQGELTTLRVNQLRNMVQHVLNLTTSNRPAFDARPINSDLKSQAQSILGNQLLEFYLREKRLEVLFRQAVEHALVLNEGTIAISWNPDVGEVYEVDEQGAPVKEGDIQFEMVMANNRIRDVDGGKDWVIIRKKVNKWALAQRYPEWAEKIIASDLDNELNYLNPYNQNKTESDLIDIYVFYHNKTDALPTGKMAVFLSNEAVLSFGDLPYSQIPVYTIMPSEIPDSIFGYTPTFDALPLQEAINILSSTALTNQKAFGVSNIWTQDGSNFSLDELSSGMNLITSAVKPEVLSLTATPAEVFEFRQQLIQEMQQIMGINSTVRGEPPTGASGTLSALLVSTAVSFNSGLQQSYNQLLEDVGTNTLAMLRDYAKTKRVVSILGINEKSWSKEFVGDDLNQINRVHVEQASAMSRTSAGRIEIANQLLQTGLIKDAEQYLMVVNTGKLEPLVEAQTNNLLLVRAENEMLKNGQLPVALMTDPPELHITEHLSVLSTPESRQDPAIIQATLQHVQEHLNLWRSADPAILMLLKSQPAPMPAVQPMQNGVDPQQPQEMAQQAQIPQPPAEAGPQAQENMNQANLSTGGVQ
jgi:hypothetical protein